MTQFLQTFPPTFAETIGVIGFGLYVTSYSLLTMHKLTSQSKTYFGINLVAATCVLIGLTQSFNLASALIQTFWIAISIIAICMRVRPSPQNQQPT